MILNFIGFVGKQVFEVLWFVYVKKRDNIVTVCTFLSFWMNLRPQGFFPMRNQGESVKHIKSKVFFLFLSKV
jgi:hypothetical protein